MADRLTTSMKSSSYFDLSPEELKELYNESSRFLSKNQRSLDADSLYGLLYQHFYLALLCNEDSVAKVTLQRISDRFGDSSHVAILRAQYLEATEGVKVAQEYLSSRNNTDFAAFKRKTVILKVKGDLKTYTQELINYLSICPTDSECWVEVAEAYYQLGLYAEAIHALQEVIIQVPLAYNMFARLAEIQHVQATLSLGKGGSTLDQLKQSISQFLRSVELCPLYVRGWSGVYVVSKKLLDWPKMSENDKTRYSKLRSIARTRLEEIVSLKRATPQDLHAAGLILKT